MIRGTAATAGKRMRMLVNLRLEPSSMHKFVGVIRQFHVSRIVSMGCILLFLLCSMACNNSSELGLRPSNIPREAAWTGGLDGGAYIYCKSPEDGPNACNVYFANGELYRSGKYVLAESGAAASEHELRYKAADGKRIYLENGTILVRAGETHNHP